MVSPALSAGGLGSRNLGLGALLQPGALQGPSAGLQTGLGFETRPDIVLAPAAANPEAAATQTLAPFPPPLPLIPRHPPRFV